MDNELVAILTGIKSDLGELKGDMRGVKSEIKLTREDMNRRVTTLENRQRKEDWLHTLVVLPLSVILSWLTGGKLHA